MRFRFLLSDPRGDIELSPQDLKQPFLITPSEEHPFLTLNDYFEALRKFISNANFSVLQKALKKKYPDYVHDPATADEIVIRSEKHGAYYHVASLTFTDSGKRRKFALTTAISSNARDCLAEEFTIMNRLANMNPEYLADLFNMVIIPWHTDAGEEDFLVVLGEWLEDFHEWHLSTDPDTGKPKIQLWDYVRGYRFLSDKESYKMLRQVAGILTFYYDQTSFRQIYPWHHGAGDFIVKAVNDTIQVRLITARQYEPLVYFEEAEKSDRLVAAIHFLLNLSLRIRLDRYDGVGEPVWLDDSAVLAALAGFADGLGAAESIGRLKIGPIAEFMKLMRSFDVREIMDMYESLLAIYTDEDQDDFDLIQQKIAEHATDLHAALQNFS